MDHYIDINLDSECGINHSILMNKVFSKLHKTIAHILNGKLAVSFPNHSTHLGDILRVHGNYQDLEVLNSSDWLEAFDGYLCNCGIKKIPSEIMGFRTVSRVTPKSPSALRRRSVRKGWLTEEEALIKIPDSKAVHLEMPFVTTHSSSNGNRMLIFIKHGLITQESLNGAVSSYGLSKQQTIPWF